MLMGQQDLGLGVLEALDGGGQEDSSEEEEHDSADKSPQAGREDSILDTLMGNKRPRKRRKLINEV